MEDWASPSGALYTNKWYYETNENSTSINYYGADGQQCTGLQTIDGIQYIFDANGTLAVSRTVSLGEDNYYCDAEGAVHEMPNNEWYKGDNGSWYYVKNGRMARSEICTYNGVCYKADANGHATTATDGVYRKGVSDDLYYVSDGKTAKKVGSKLTENITILLKQIPMVCIMP